MVQVATGVRRALIKGALLGAGICSPLVPAAAHAATLTCRTDPQIFLSNGYRFEMTASLPVDPSQVESVHYALNAPHGVSVDSIVWTGNAPFSETLSFQAANAGQRYESVTTVYLKNGATATVTAQDQVNNQVYGGGTKFANTSGPSGTPLSITLTSN